LGTILHWRENKLRVADLAEDGPERGLYPGQQVPVPLASPAAAPQEHPQAGQQAGHGPRVLVVKGKIAVFFFYPLVPSKTFFNILKKLDRNTF
jgi:hypothetical protein